MSTTHFWGQPANCRKFHVFREYTALCGKWMFRALDQPVTEAEVKNLQRYGPGDSDCAACVKRLLADLLLKKQADSGAKGGAD